MYKSTRKDLYCKGRLLKSARHTEAAKLGEPLEIKLMRAQKAGQPIEGGITPPIYTEEDDPEARKRTDYRFDRYQESIDMHDRFHEGQATRGQKAEAAEMMKSTGAGGNTDEPQK